MPEFAYRAYDRTGKEVDGSIEAENQGAVVARLHQTGFFPVEVGPAGVTTSIRRGGKHRIISRRLGAKELGHFTRELSVLLNAGLPLERALQVLTGAGFTNRMREVVLDLLAKLQGGMPFSDALENQDGRFSRLYVNLVRAGEAAGALASVMTRLAEYMDKSRELRDAITSALIYPIILVAVAIVSLAVLLTQVVPQFGSLFADSGSSVPDAAVFVIAAGEWLTEFWWVLPIGLLCILFLGKVLVGVPSVRRWLDRALLGAPLLGDLLRKLEVARLSRTLGTLLANGVNLLAAMGIVRDTIANSEVAGGISTLTENLKEGKGLATPLAESGLFPDLATQMARVGEETGQLDVMLEKIADLYDEEVTLALKRLLAILEPCLILLLGLLIGGIIMAVLSAVLSINELAF